MPDNEVPGQGRNPKMALGDHKPRAENEEAGRKARILNGFNGMFHRKLRVLGHLEMSVTLMLVLLSFRVMKQKQIEGNSSV